MISYEKNLLHDADKQLFLDSFCEAFALEKKTLSIAMKKVISKDYSELITNYDELKTYLEDKNLLYYLD